MKVISILLLCLFATMAYGTQYAVFKEGDSVRVDQLREGFITALSVSDNLSEDMVRKAYMHPGKALPILVETVMRTPFSGWGWHHEEESTYQRVLYDPTLGAVTAIGKPYFILETHERPLYADLNFLLLAGCLVVCWFILRVTTWPTIRLSKREWLLMMFFSTIMYVLFSFIAFDARGAVSVPHLLAGIPLIALCMLLDYFVTKLVIKIRLRNYRKHKQKIATA